MGPIGFREIIIIAIVIFAIWAGKKIARHVELNRRANKRGSNVSDTRSDG